MGNTMYCRVTAGDGLASELKNTYATLNVFDWPQNPPASLPLRVQVLIQGQIDPCLWQSFAGVKAPGFF